MRLILATVCTAIVVAAALPAEAQLALQTPQFGPNSPPLKCSDFNHNSDGTWSPVHDVTINYPNGNVSVGPDLKVDQYGYMGMPLAQLLAKQCGSP
jgi:hypothetical protein